MWMLGSSDYSAQVAGALGLPFSFAHHFASRAPSRASRSTGRVPAVGELDQPYAMIGVPVICAETAERAHWLAGPSGLSFVRLRQGRPSRLPTPEEAADTCSRRPSASSPESWTSPLIAGDPDEVRDGLDGSPAEPEPTS